MMKKIYLAALIVINTVGCSILDQGGKMNLKNLKQPPKNTTLMGVVKGISDYWIILDGDEKVSLREGEYEYI